MKRNSFLFSILVFIGSGLFAQSLELKFGDKVVTNDSVYYSGTITDDLLEMHIKVTNLTDKDIEVKVRKTEILLVDNSVNYFCWGSCFLPHVLASPTSVIISAESTDSDSFSGDYEPYGFEGTSIISYTFYNAQNEEDSVMLTTFYQVGANGIRDLMVDNENVLIYPNPAVDHLNIEFKVVPENPYTIRLLALNGQVLSELVRDSRVGSIQFSLEKLPASYTIVEISDSKGLSIRRKVLIRR